MKSVQCPNKHYYDAELFSSCPHCQRMGLATPQAEAQNNQQTVNPGASALGRTVGLNNTVNLSNNLSPTLPLYAVTENAETQQPHTVAPSFQSDKTISPFTAAFQTDRTISPQMEDIAPNAGQTREPADVSPLQREVNATNATSIKTDFKTVGFFNFQENDAQEHAEPVVGWLVALSGAHLGQSFEIRSGKNNIGRDAGMDICLSKEPTVSRNKHAVLIFDPVNSRFILQAGEGSGLVYVNGKLVVDHKNIRHREIIELGSTKLMLIALCGPSFTWEAYIKR